MKSPLLSAITGIEHDFGGLAEPFPEAWQTRWNADKPLWKQVHGTAAAEVIGPSQTCGEVDALHTRKPDRLIAVVTADCLPVLFAKKDGSHVAAIHAGWRGLIAGITEKLWAELERGGERARDWVAAIGPAIGPCCYEVSEELADRFLAHYSGKIPGKTVVPEHRRLALAHTQAASLRALGFAAVEILPFCTRCSRDADGSFLSHSYRREGGGTRQWSVIGISAAARV